MKIIFYESQVYESVDNRSLSLVKTRIQGVKSYSPRASPWFLPLHKSDYNNYSIKIIRRAFLIMPPP